MSNAKIIDERVVGTRIIDGQAFAVTDRLTRIQGGAMMVWVLAEGYCNGGARCETTYRSRNDALAAWRTKPS